MVVKAQSGDKVAYAQLLSLFESAVCELHSENQVTQELNETIVDILTSIDARFDTCDPSRSVADWLLAIIGYGTKIVFVGSKY